MTYTNAEKMIENAPNIGSPDAAKQILWLLKNPEKKLQIIKVLGESGKSSVCSLLSAAISAAGYRVGRLTTPHIHSVRESVCVCERPVSIELFTNAAENVSKQVTALRKSEESADTVPSQSDLLLTTALCAFDESDCDVAIIEVARNESFSCIDEPIISVITSTSDTRTAREICLRLDRQSGEIITAMQSREVYRIIFDKCAEINKRLTMPLRNAFIFMSASVKRIEFTYNGTVHSVGTGAYYQIYNLLTVIEAVEALNRLGFNIPSTEICSAVLSRGIPLRFEIISVMPTIIIDRADDENRRRRLIESLKILSTFTNDKPTVICESGKRKIAEEFALMSRDIATKEIPIKTARKELRSMLSGLSDSDTLIILGSSQYCEQMAKITKDILM